MKHIKQTFALLITLALTSVSAHAEFTNGGFEDDFNQWTVGGDGYLVTDNGSGRLRHNYQTYQGWEGADVWLGAFPPEGDTYAVFGSFGNESAGSLLSGAWSATHRYVSFQHAGNNSSGQPTNNQSVAEIQDLSGNTLASINAISYNDSTWRTWQIDLTSIGLNYGDQFKFYYEDRFSWSVVDNVAQTGEALLVANDVPTPFAISALGLLGLGLLRRKNIK